MKKAAHRISLLHHIAIAMLGLLAAACISNDIPYPRIQPNFLTFNVVGQDGGTAIDSASRTVTLALEESADIYKVQVSGYTITPGAVLEDDIFTAPIDMSSPVSVTLTLYQPYIWTLKATQTIERYFEVEDQVGTTLIDVPGRRVIIKVARSADLSKLKVIRAKLANEGSTMQPDIAEGGIVNATEPVPVRVFVFDHVQDWTVYFETVEELVTTTAADAWTNVLWIYGQAQVGSPMGAQYRLQGDEEWIDVPQTDITSDGGSFTARVAHASPQTTYEVRAISGTDKGKALTVTTGSIAQLPNGDFDQWWLDGKIWCPWAEDGTPFWGTGNKGATTLGPSNTVPTDDTPSGTGWAAKLETKFVGIGVIGKLAAGNIFAGSYVRTDGTNGVLSFGRPFTERPTALKGYYKYSGVPISNSDTDHKDLIGRPDTAIVWVALIDSSEPFEIRTNPKNRQLFDENAPEVIAYGKLQQSEPVSDYIPFRFELQYKSTSRVPRYILITASASKYGDFFTGGSGSVLCVDDFVLDYDY